jgi:hypothetical protein
MPNPNRRSFLALAMATTVASASGASARKRTAAPSLADDVGTYVGFGPHRVGTPGQRKTARWLSGRLDRLGFETRVEPFAMETILNPTGSLRFAGETISAFPQWYPPKAALGKALTAPLKPLSEAAGQPSLRFVDTPIGFAPNWNKGLDQLAEAAAAKGALALILAIDIPSGDLFVCNQHSSTPLPLPVALVAKRDLPRLAAGAGQGASLRLSGKSATVDGANVVATKPGIGQRIIISTPLTGWFTCGGERGPGIALWLRMAKLLAASPRPVTMLGTGSHEIGHHGIEHHLAEHPIEPADVALWLHFGASLGATRLDEGAGFKSPQYLVGLPETEARAKAAFAKHLPFYVAGGPQTQGEAGPIIAAGHRSFMGMSGMFPAFHTEADRGEAIDFAKLEEIAGAAEGLLRQFA